MDAALDGTSVGAVSAGASSFSFFAAARVAASARLADLHKRISKGNHQNARARDMIETIGRRRFPKRKNRKRERPVPALVTTRRRRRRRPRRRRGDRRRQRH